VAPKSNETRRLEQDASCILFHAKGDWKRASTTPSLFDIRKPGRFFFYFPAEGKKITPPGKSKNTPRSRNTKASTPDVLLAAATSYSNATFQLKAWQCAVLLGECQGRLLDPPRKMKVNIIPTHRCSLFPATRS